MKKRGFRCELLSDLVLPVSAATEGHSTALAYIPGAKFSGIVARHYDEYSAKQKSYDIFHSGKIRFTDAHPLGEENEHTWKIPFAWYVQKGAKIKKGNTIIKENIFIFTGPGKERQMEKQGKQYKQIRRGFISRNGEFVQNETRFSLKSAYDPKVRRAREGQLFGYEALNKGRKWFFSVCADDDVDEETLAAIKNHLAGTHSIGRSRTAQYGRVEIIPVDALKETECFSPQEGYCYLYAESNLCFYDNYGEPVLTPDIGSLGFEKNEDATIVWELSHIRPFVYAPWNNKRYQRDRDRVCIAKGSVITLKLSKPGEFDITAYHDRHAKFDEEIVYKGSRFVFELEIIKDNPGPVLIDELIQTLNEPDFRIGGGTRRGFGRLRIVEMCERDYDLTSETDLMAYLDKSTSLNQLPPGFKKREVHVNTDSPDITLSIKPGDLWVFGSGISDEEADATPLCEEVIEWENGIPRFTEKQFVIPASSIKGALSHRTAFHYNRLTKKFADQVANPEDHAGVNNKAVQVLFGTHKNKDGKTVRGKVIFSDIFFKKKPDSVKILNHNKIDRFTGGTLQGALFSEKVVKSKQSFTLEIYLEKGCLKDEEIRKAFESALEDLCTGMLPLGGSVMHGHGIFMEVQKGKE